MRINVIADAYETVQDINTEAAAVVIETCDDMADATAKAADALNRGERIVGLDARNRLLSYLPRQA